MRTVEDIIENNALMRYMILNDGKSYGLIQVGVLISRTVTYVCSGFSFFPILIEFYNTSKEKSIETQVTRLVFVLMTVYIFVIVLYFGYTVKIVVSKGQIIKDQLIEEIEKKMIFSNSSVDQYINEQRVRHIAQISVNPIVSDIVLKLLYETIVTTLLPATVSILLGIK